MSNEERTTKACRESRVIQTHRVFPTDLNSHGTLFGGKLMSLIDDTASISITRHSRRNAVTASMDRLDFLHPINENHSVCVETYVSGTGRKSMEVFAKIIGEDLVSGDRYLAATCFMTFVAVPSPEKPEKDFTVPHVVPETDEEKMVTSGYEERRKRGLQELAFHEQFSKTVSLDVPWG
ncbi:acyl-CoA thioesterase [Vagococcus sp. PNs007]|uniref:Acyl-CoA thioesterase n=1 Tax=Vagococcus proximus TaxID=2991417 RepID=A0ABT5X0Y3_9ENTE|nr:acyl-CoA thioesterase [Vagococcus proximus]MDF0479649.1 acyl-CoA thioesterase [Vagococcus proximus]